MKTNQFSIPFLLLFLKGKEKVSKKLGSVGNFVIKSAGETKMRWDFFIFIFPRLAVMVTDTAFRKSRLGKFILEKILTGSSKNQPYHADLLVFCLKFKFSPVCEYRNCYYNITNDCWAIPEKSRQGGLRTYLFLKKPWIFEVCHFTLGNYGQNKDFFTIANSVKFCYTSWKFQGQKPRHMKMQHDFFLIIPKNFTFTLGNSGQNKALLLKFCKIA